LKPEICSEWTNSPPFCLRRFWHPHRQNADSPMPTEVEQRLILWERSNLTRTFLLTTGTFNQVVKDRFASPPERRVFSPAGFMKNPAVLETLQKYRSRCCPVNRLNQQDFHKKSQLLALSL